MEQQQPRPTVGEQPMAVMTTEATANNEATTTNEAVTTTNDATANEEAEPAMAATTEAATTGAEHMPPAPGEDGGEANPDRVETDDHFNPAQEDLDLFDEEDILAEYEGDIHQQKWIRYQQNSKL
jgi:hypothetical protein